MTQVGQLLINDILPPKYRDTSRVLDKKGIKKLLTDIATNDKEQYQEILGKLGRFGALASQRSGGYSLATDIIKTPEITKRHRKLLQAKLKKIYEDDKLTPKEKDELVQIETMESAEKMRNELYDDLLNKESPIALMVASGAKGNKFSVSAGVGYDGLYEGPDGKPVPYPVLHNYGEGLNPFEYWAGTHGARKGVVDTKRGTADGGALSKQLVQVAHKNVISRDDDPNPTPHQNYGLPSETNDNDNIGRYLAQPVGEYKRNTLITDAVLKDLQNKKINDILVRSPIVGGPKDGSLYANDVGISERNRPYVAGENPGIPAVQAMGEVISQSILSSKHSGGVMAGTAKGVSAFKRINQMLQVPSVYENGAVHAQLDGRVGEIKTDELGNQIITIGAQEHFVPRDRKVTIKSGDEIEAGDQLTDGLPNPAEFVKYKGIGEGRRSFVQAMNAELRNAGINTSKRNIELLAKGLIDHITIDDEHDDYLPNDVVSYTKYEADYKPREGATKGRPDFFKGHYLEEPVLHYTIGTQLKPSVLANLKKYGVNEIVVHKEPPRFQAEMVRAMSNTSVSDDWLTRMGGSYQQRGILNAAQRGLNADPFGPSAYPAIVGRTDFTKRKPGQPDPIIKSILPELPNTPIVMPSNKGHQEYEVDTNWFLNDG